MTWWQTLLIAVVPAIVTATAVVTQSYISAQIALKREQAARDADNEAARLARARDAHVTAIKAMNAFQLRAAAWERATSGSAREAPTDIPALSLDELSAAHAQLVLAAPKASSSIYGRYVRDASRIDDLVHAFDWTLAPDHVVRMFAKLEVVKTVWAAGDEQSQYIDAAHAECGVG